MPLNSKNFGISELRVLKALAGGGALTAGKLGKAAGLAGSAAGGVVDALVKAGLLDRRELDVDGKAEAVWLLTDAGRARAGEGREAGAGLPEPPGGKRAVGALVPLYGSNRLLASRVGEALAGCAWVGIPFAGGLCELPHIGARTVVANDLHGGIINLATVAANRTLGPQLYRRLRRSAFHPATLRAAQEFCRTREAASWNGKPDLRWAEAYFISAWMARNGEAGKSKEFNTSLSVRWNAGGGDSVVRFRSAVKALVDWRRTLARCTFVCTDALKFLDRCADRVECGVYCDPPFPGPGDAYKHAFEVKRHEQLAERLAKFRLALVVCRFYDVPLVRELYPEGKWEWRTLVGRKGSNALAPEVLLVRNAGNAKPGNGEAVSKEVLTKAVRLGGREE